ncbi:MAG: MFS transporter [Candidatus Dormibacteraeota bacterium]|nr:MFS transporter [Candidatus Dormibacteraeota bacterium]
MRFDTGYGPALRIRDYRLLLSGLAVSQIGSWAFSVALAVMVFDRTHSPAWVAGASVARFGTALVVSAYGGVIAERLERVRLMVRLDLVSFALMSALAAVAALQGPVVLAIVLATLTTAISTVYGPAAKATTPALVGTEHLAAANGLESTAENLAIVAGPAAGAALLLLGSPAIAFAVNAASFAFSAVAVTAKRDRTSPSDVTEGGAAGPLRQMLAGVRAILASHTVALLVAFSVGASFVYGTDTVLLIVISRDVLGTGADGYGYLLAGLGVGGVAAAVLTNRLASQPRLGTIIALAMIVYCAPTAVFLVVHAPAAGFATEVVRGAGTLVVDVLAVTAMQRLVPSDVVARVFGVFFAGVLAAVAIGALVTPMVLSAAGLDVTLLLAAFAVPALVLLLYPFVRRIDAAALDQLAHLAPRVRVLQGLAIFEGASRPILERLGAACRPETVAAGTVIVREGDAADDFFVLVEGEATVSAVGERGRVAALDRLVAPSYFGEIGLLERVPRTATVTASTSATLWRIAGDEFIDALSATTLSPSAVGLTQLRLARTHPSRALTLAGTRR